MTDPSNQSIKAQVALIGDDHVHGGNDAPRRTSRFQLDSGGARQLALHLKPQGFTGPLADTVHVELTYRHSVLDVAVIAQHEHVLYRQNHPATYAPQGDDGAIVDTLAHALGRYGIEPLFADRPDATRLRGRVKEDRSIHTTETNLRFILYELERPIVTRGRRGQFPVAWTTHLNLSLLHRLASGHVELALCADGLPASTIERKLTADEVATVDLQNEPIEILVVEFLKAHGYNFVFIKP